MQPAKDSVAPEPSCLKPKLYRFENLIALRSLSKLWLVHRSGLRPRWGDKMRWLLTQGSPCNTAPGWVSPPQGSQAGPPAWLFGR